MGGVVMADTPVLALGIDLSPRATGIAYLEERDRGRWSLRGYDVVKTVGPIEGAGDLSGIAERIRILVEEVPRYWGAQVIGIETPIVGPNGRAAIAQAMLFGMLWTMIEPLGPLAVNPTSTKVAMTGRGNADKDAMVRLARGRAPGTRKVVTGK